MSQNTDPRTGRPYGDHGTHEDAVEWALESGRCDDREGFLDAWKYGAAYEEWPEYYDWLKEKGR